MELILKHFSLKFNTLKLLIEKIIIIDSTQIILLNNLSDIEVKFVLCVIPLQMELHSDEINRHKITEEFQTILLNENFSIDINKLFNTCIDILYQNNIYIRVSEEILKHREKKKKAKKLYSNAFYLEIQELVDLFPINIEFSNSINFINYRICDICYDCMEIDTINSELICYTCAMVKPLIGISFENIQFYSYDNQKTKTGTFNPNRHFYFWWNRILAKEDELDVNSELIDNIMKIIQRDKKVLRMLTVIDIRNILRELKKTELNKNIPLILKKITGIGPPSIPESIEIQVENIFTKVIEICESIKRYGRTNRNYYPYYIYKIIDNIIPESDFENRRILYYIYIQSKETVELDDLDWEKICEHISELTYRPTDRSEYLKYQPN
jgi:hypothetical protein